MHTDTLERSLIFATLAVLAFTPAAGAEFRLERELALTAGGTFLLDSDVGSIEIRGADGDGARIVVTAASDDVEQRYAFSFEERSGDAMVRVEKRGSWASRWFKGGSDRVRFEIQVPRGANVDLSTAGGSIDARDIRGRVDLDSSGGRIEAAEIDGDVNAHTSGGPVTVLDVSGGARLETSGGAIRADDVGGDLVARTSGGSIDIADAGGAVEAHTSGGPVRASFARGNGAGGSLSSSGGSVTARVDPAVSLEVDAHTSGGRVTVDLPITVRGSMSRNTVRGSLNGGGPLLELRSSGGAVRLRGL